MLFSKASNDWLREQTANTAEPEQDVRLDTIDSLPKVGAFKLGLIASSECVLPVLDPFSILSEETFVVHKPKLLQSFFSCLSLGNKVVDNRIAHPEACPVSDHKRYYEGYLHFPHRGKRSCYQSRGFR